jgi:hypothetical protein
MSDINKSLLQAYYDSITTYRASTLSYLTHHEIVQGPLAAFSSHYGTLPMVLIEWAGYSLEPDSMEGSCRSDRKVYTVNLYGLVEDYDENYGVVGNTVSGFVGTLDLTEDLETLYNRNTLSLSQGCVLTQVQPVTLALPYLLSDQQSYWFHGVQLTLEHDWIDRRIA